MKTTKFDRWNADATQLRERLAMTEKALHDAQALLIGVACQPAEFGLFDRVVMNPPFHMRSDVRHIQHARRFLKPGGRLAALCLAGPRQFAALQPIAASWEELPDRTFAKEGTGARTVLLTMTSTP